MASDRISSSVTTPPALRMTWASPSLQAEQRRTGSAGRPCRRRTATCSAGGIGRSPRSKWLGVGAGVGQEVVGGTHAPSSNTAVVARGGTVSGGRALSALGRAGHVHRDQLEPEHAPGEVGLDQPCGDLAAGRRGTGQRREDRRLGDLDQPAVLARVDDDGPERLAPPGAAARRPRPRRCRPARPRRPPGRSGPSPRAASAGSRGPTPAPPRRGTAPRRRPGRTGRPAGAAAPSRGRTPRRPPRARSARAAHRRTGCSRRRGTARSPRGSGPGAGGRCGRASAGTRRSGCPRASRRPARGPAGGTGPTVRPSGSGMVRRMPTCARSIISAAAMPVISEIWAFQSSAGTGGRKPTR